MGTNGQNTATLQSGICLLPLAGAAGLGKQSFLWVMHGLKGIWSLNISSIKETGTRLLARGSWVGSSVI